MRAEVRDVGAFGHFAGVGGGGVEDDERGTGLSKVDDPAHHRSNGTVWHGKHDDLRRGHRDLRRDRLETGGGADSVAPGLGRLDGGDGIAAVGD